MIENDTLLRIHEALGKEFCLNHFTDKQSVGKFANIVADEIQDKIMLEAFKAGFVCAGGDADEADQQSAQFLECVKNSCKNPTQDNEP